jgi:hypothetical protein
MADIKQQIINWFNGPQDYETGVALLDQVSKKNKVLAKLNRRGETKGSFEKLVWELNKTAGLKKIPERNGSAVPGTVIPLNVKFTKLADESVKAEGEQKLKFNLIGNNALSSYTSDVQRLVNEYSSLYMQRGKKHAALKKHGDGNDQATVTARKVIVDEIKEISARLEVLYEAFHDFEEKDEPVDPTQLWPEKKLTANTQQAEILSDNIEELKTLKKNIQSSVTKDRNMLFYGNKTKPKDGKERLLPAGPKRTTLEKRVAKKEAEILKIDQRIADLG